MEVADLDRNERLRQLEEFILNSQSELNIDGLLDCIQAIYTDCDYPTLRRLKCIENFIQRCECCIQTAPPQVAGGLAGLRSAECAGVGSAARVGFRRCFNREQPVRIVEVEIHLIATKRFRPGLGNLRCETKRRPWASRGGRGGGFRNQTESQ